VTAARIPPKTRAHVRARDGGCLGPRIGMPGDCFGCDSIDHIIVGGLGVKCKPDPALLATLCVSHHRLKTDHANTWRYPLLLKVAELEARVATGYWPAD
jgi:hypothetical protein